MITLIFILYIQIMKRSSNLKLEKEIPYRQPLYYNIRRLNHKFEILILLGKKIKPLSANARLLGHLKKNHI